MLSIDVIRKYYPQASEEELKEIQEVVYLLSCAIMQEFYGPPSRLAGEAGRRASPFWRVDVDGRF